MNHRQSIGSLNWNFRDEVHVRRELLAGLCIVAQHRHIDVCFAELNCAALVDSRILMAMTWSTHQLFEVLRVSMLTLLVLGIAIRPVLQFIGEAHASDHRVAAESHGHDHGHDSVPGHDPVPDHTSGVHALMHQTAGGSTFSVNTFVMALPEVAFELLATPLLAPSRVPLQLIEGPFRPPIA